MDLGLTTAKVCCHGSSATAPGSGIGTRDWLAIEAEFPNQTNPQRWFVSC